MGFFKFELWFLFTFGYGWAMLTPANTNGWAKADMKSSNEQGLDYGPIYRANIDMSHFIWNIIDLEFPM